MEGEMDNLQEILPVPGQCIKPVKTNPLFARTVRVLLVNKDRNKIVVIEIEPRRSKSRLYFCGPRIEELSDVQKQLKQRNLHLLIHGVQPRPDVMATDEDLDRKYLRKEEEISQTLANRHSKYSLIEPLVRSTEDIELLFDTQVRREKIQFRAKELFDRSCSWERLLKKITETLNQFFAEGSTPGAVTPFSAAQGGRGKQRTQKRKIGRKNTPTRNGIEGIEGFLMTERDKDICGFSWRNYLVRGKTVAKALRKMWREFYSEISQGESGQTQHILLPPHQRPTRTQFERWGPLRSPGHESWKKQLSKSNLARLGRVLFGTADEGITRVGQRGAVDSTSGDVELVSVTNRLERIGPVHRILIVDGLYGYIPGFYSGLDAPSAKTVRLAFLNALTDKREWLEWLGLNDQDPKDWIPIRFNQVTADNTDLRCEEVIESLKSIGTSLSFVGVARSDLNSAVEASHHIIHRLSDHNLPGTTHGQRHERGDERPDILARLTIVEAIRETARAIHLHNTIELDIKPTLEMRRELLDKGIKLTRANLTRWAINKGKLATSLIGEDEARIKLLTKMRGTFTQKGIRLLRPDRGEKREFIEPHRFVSRDQLILQRCLEAKVMRARRHPQSFDDDFLVDPFKLTEIFFRDPVSGRLIELQLATKDIDLPFECALSDVLELMGRDTLHLFGVQSSREEALSGMERAQEQTSHEAGMAYDEELGKLDRPPSKSALRKNKKENRAKEKNSLPFGVPAPIPEHNSPMSTVEVEPEEADAMASTPIPASPKVALLLQPSIPTGNLMMAAVRNRRKNGDQNAR